MTVRELRTRFQDDEVRPVYPHESDYAQRAPRVFSVWINPRRWMRGPGRRATAPTALPAS